MIKNVHAYPINLAVSPEFMIRSSAGLHSYSDYVLMCIENSDGTVGWGEATVVINWSGETQDGALSIVRRIFTPILLGRDPFDLAAIMRDLDMAVIGNSFTKAAVEMALLDLQGKLLNVPLYKLLGGEVNPLRIPIKFSIGLREPEDAAAIALQKVREGFRAIKIKVGPDLASDLLRVQLVREAIGPDVRVNIDVNGGWGVKESIRNIPQFERFDLEYVEQPTPRWDIDGMAQVRNATALPIMADESAFTPEQATEIIRKNAADLLSVYPGKNGGILKSQQICKMAESAGIPCHIGSNLECDLATSAMCHLAVATTNVRVERFPVDILGPLYYRVRLPENPVLFADGYVHVPEGPGLGLRIDEDTIRACRKTSAYEQETAQV